MVKFDTLYRFADDAMRTQNNKKTQNNNNSRVFLNGREFKISNTDEYFGRIEIEVEVNENSK